MPVSSSECLGPEDLRIAADALEIALSRIEETCRLSLPTVRQTLAAAIVEATFAGERDVERLSALALKRLAKVSGRS